MQLLLNDHDARMFELSKKIFEVIAICGREDQKDAAFFLTEQLPLVQEERRELVLENEQFHLSNQELINDIERAKGDLDRLRVFIDPSLDLNSTSQTEILANFKEKLDRVHERIEIEKAEERVSLLTELRTEIEHTEIDTAREMMRKKLLQDKLSE